MSNMCTDNPTSDPGMVSFASIADLSKSLSCLPLNICKPSFQVQVAQATPTRVPLS